MKKLFLILGLLSSTLVAAQDELYEYCEEIPLNTAVKVIIPSSRSKTTTQKYTLLRRDEKTYDVFLNLSFKPGKKYDGPFKNKNELNSFYKSEMNKCFARMENFLIDERGRKLRLHIFDKNKDKLPSAPPMVNIKVENAEHRSNSFAYESDISCPIMIHEAFHLLGLIDEYEEKWKGYNHKFFSLAFKPFVPVNDNVKPAFDCRALGPRDSIMSNHNYIYFGNGLRSGHVNTIIYPNCKEKNEKYYSCSRFAYKTSFANNGGLPNISNCANKVPDYCKDPSWIDSDI